MTKLTKNLSKRKSKNQDWILPGDTNLELEYPIDAMTIPKLMVYQRWLDDRILFLKSCKEPSNRSNINLEKQLAHNVLDFCMKGEFDWPYIMR